MKKILILLLIFIILLISIFFGFKFLLKGKDKKKTEVKVVDNIEEYGYTLDDIETKYYKSLFADLKKILSSESMEEEEYAKKISQLFLTDFFHLDNKLTKNDIGGTQFVYDSFRNDFEKLAKESIYHYVESNIYGDRKQELPKVSEVQVIDMEQKSYSYLDTEDEFAYYIDLKISYEKDLGYQEECSLILVHHDNKLEIVKMKQ